MIENTTKGIITNNRTIHQSSVVIDKIHLLKKNTHDLETEAEKLMNEKGEASRVLSKQKSLELHMKITSSRVQIILLSEGIAQTLSKPKPTDHPLFPE